ncbi:MAG: ribose-phosphate pyrophosphokinase [Caulobacteraceae bacterium]
MRLILPLPGQEAMATRLAELGRHELGAVEMRRFPDGESYVRIASDVSGRHVDLVCTLARPDERFLGLVFAAEAVRDLGAASVRLIAPYLAYMRQDRRFKPGEAVTSATFARLISGAFDALVTVDPHLHRYPALTAVYTIPAQALHAADLIADWIADQVEQPLVVGPDEESRQWVSAVAARAGAPHVVLHKDRHGDRDVSITVPDLGIFRGRRPVLVDDIISSGRTMIEAARQLVAQGMPKPVCVAVHALFANDAYPQLLAVADRVVTTDTVPHPSNAVSVALLIAAQSEGGDVPSRRL